MPALKSPVIPANAGIQFIDLNALRNIQMNNLDSRIRGNDGGVLLRFAFAGGL
jgi:hypothetical protein